MYVVNKRDFEASNVRGEFVRFVVIAILRLATSKNSMFVRFVVNNRDFEVSNVEKFNVC